MKVKSKLLSDVRPKFSEKRENVILVQDRISKTSKHSLRPALRCRRITPYSTNVRPIPRGAFIINFGGGTLPVPYRDDFRVLNKPEAIALSANKLRTFELLAKSQVPTVKWTTTAGDVFRWISKGHKVLVRSTLSSSGGRGITCLETCGSVEAVPNAPLFTRYFPKTHEFRVHVVGGKAIDLTEKKLREELKEKRDAVSIVRSHDNGWVHAHGDLSIVSDIDRQNLEKLGMDAVRAVGLDFGAVDILASLDSNVPRRLSKAVVCEVNSAPGIENEVTRKAYADALNKLITEAALV